MPDTRTVLIVDDEPDAVAFAEAMLSEIDGLTAVSAHDGPSGLEKAREAAPALIILDVQMPGMDGFAVFAELKKEPATKGIPVVMLTGVGQKVGISFSAEEVGKLTGEKPEAYLEKPIEPQAFQKAVKQALGL